MKGLIKESGKIVGSILAVIMFQASEKEKLTPLLNTEDVV